MGHPRAVDLGRQHLAALAAQQRQQSGPSNPAWNPAASWIPRDPQQYGQAGQASIPPQCQPHPQQQQQQQRGGQGPLASGGSGPLQNGMAPAGSGAKGPVSSPRPPVASRVPSSRNRGFEGLEQDDLERAKRSRLNTAPVWLRSQSMPMQGGGPPEGEKLAGLASPAAAVSMPRQTAMQAGGPAEVRSCCALFQARSVPCLTGACPKGKQLGTSPDSCTWVCSCLANVWNRKS